MGNQPAFEKLKLGTFGVEIVVLVGLQDVV